ncbi:MAG: M67 family peptidase [Rhodospirillaceae bacterium]|nr:M67 family peptidase [Rhodospirillaceae bacterium]
MIRFRPDHLKAVVDAAEDAYPVECCGLLVGRRGAGSTAEVTRLAPSPNLAASRERFEIDPGLFLRLHKELEGGGESIVGLYHSHPDYPSQPSPRDLDAAWDAELIWVIVSVRRGQAIHVTAHALDAGLSQFHEIPLRTIDGSPAASGAILERG